MGSASSEMAHFGENAVIFEILRKCQVSFKLNRVEPPIVGHLRKNEN